MKKKNTEVCHRKSGSTYREYKHNNEYMRPKRKVQADCWDLERRNSRYDQKSWKNKREHQYIEGGRGTERFVIIDLDTPEWRHYTSQACCYIEEMLDKQDIPYVSEDILSSAAYMAWYHVPYRACTLIRTGQVITWWSDKDIGMDRILHTLPQPSPCIMFRRAWA